MSVAEDGREVGDGLACEWAAAGRYDCQCLMHSLLHFASTYNQIRSTQASRMGDERYQVSAARSLLLMATPVLPQDLDYSWEPAAVGSSAQVSR